MRFKITPKVKDLTNTSRREFSVNTREHPICTDSYWDGGSRSYFRVINLETGKDFIPPMGKYPWTVKNDYTLQTGDVVIDSGHRGDGKIYVDFWCLPSDLDRILRWLRVNPTEEIK